MPPDREALPRLKTSARVVWLRFLDRVKPRRGVGGRPSPRIEEAAPAMAARIEEILSRREDEPVAFFGGPPGTKFEITSSPWGQIKTVQVPDSEIVLPPGTPTIRVGFCDQYVDCEADAWAGTYCKLAAGHDGPCSAHYPEAGPDA